MPAKYEKDWFDNKPHSPKEIDLGFMCKKPQDCPSHQMNGFSCRCIRENFENARQFKEWVDKLIMDLGLELESLLPEEYR